MTEVAKVLYIVVLDNEQQQEKDKDKDKGKESFRYTRPVLQSTLQLMGCKARHAFKISQRAFELIRKDYSRPLEGSVTRSSDKEFVSHWRLVETEVWNHLDLAKNGEHKKIPFELYKRRTTVIVKREAFLDVVCKALAEYKYVSPNQRADLFLACSVPEDAVMVVLSCTGRYARFGIWPMVQKKI